MTGCEDTKKSHRSRSTHRPPSNRPVSPRPQEALLRCSHPQARPLGLYSFSESLRRSTSSFSAPDSHWSISHGLFHVHRVALRATLTAVSLTLSLSQSPSLSPSHTHGVTSTLGSLSHTHRVSVTLTASPSHCVSHIQGHPQTDTQTHTHGVLLTRSVLHSWSPPHAQGPAHTHGVPLGHALTRSVSHVPAARLPRAGLREPHPACSGGAESSAPAERGPSPAPAALLPRPGSLGAPARGPLPRGGPAPPGCSVALPPPPPRPLRPRPRHVIRRRIATARAASGQGAWLRAGLAGGGASGPQGAAVASGIPPAALRGLQVRSQPPAGRDPGPAPLAD